MKLLIDIGNTNTSIALAEGEKIVKRFFIHTSRKKVEPGALKRLLRGELRNIDEIIVVSVVPKFRTVIRRSLRNILPEASIRFVGEGVDVPLKIKYKSPREVGQDRLVTSFAARELYGAPVLIVDFGTAVTFDLINARGEYEGGLIFPGLRMGLRSLAEDTALLPKIEKITTAGGLIGRDTRGSINKGIVFGYAAVCDGVVERFRKSYGRSLRVVATGGDAGLIAKYTCRIKTVCPDLIFIGLRLIS